MTALAFRISDVLEVSARWLVWGTGPVAKWEPLTAEEKEFLTLYRALPAPLRDYAMAQLRELRAALESPAPSRAFPFQTPRLSSPSSTPPRKNQEVINNSNRA